ncbi:MAG: hypothetical protein WCP70_02125 [Methanothrix sp.]
MEFTWMVDSATPEPAREWRCNSSTPRKNSRESCPPGKSLPKDEAGNFIAEQERSDLVHDLLAFLAERMLEMNKEKQTEIKGFLGWLESYLGAKVEDLTPKTKLQSYYEHDYEGFLAVLKRNSKKLAVDPARREPSQALRAEFEGSMGKLAPLRERIRKTDELIDATVYRLYELTEEEIGIVEGKA